MTLNPFIARFSNEPAIIDTRAGDRFVSCLNAVAGHPAWAQIEGTPTEAAGDFWTELGSWSDDLRPYVVDANGFLHIPIRGVLLKNFPYTFFGWATGYEYIRAAFDRGLADDNVKAIVFDVDSPGGMVAGNFDLVDHIYAARDVKPIMGIADEHAYSAAYSLISCASPGNLYVARTGGVGSIGVVTMHVDVSSAMDKAGVKVTFIHAGKHKVEGNAYEPLSPAAEKRIQKRIDDLYSVFVSTVARNRGLEEQAVRDTEALTFSASDALSNGLADAVGTPSDALAALAAVMSSIEGDDQMSTQDKAADAQAANNEAAVTAARTEGQAEGRANERTRINAIIGCDAAKDRPVAALSAALETDMSAEQATAFLAKLPTEKTEASTQSGGAPDAFTQRMEAAGSPDIGAGGGSGEDEAKSTVDQILSDQSAVTGAKRA
jgi:signal peptide peptidase SppA